MAGRDKHAPPARSLAFHHIAASTRPLLSFLSPSTTPSPAASPAPTSPSSPEPKVTHRHPRLPFKRKSSGSSHLSVLDLPVQEYDPDTHLPHTIQVGGRTVRPFVTIQNVRDHLTILSAFQNLAEQSGARFHRVTDSAAFDYERWASMVLPVRARRQRSIASDNTTQASAVSPDQAGCSPMSAPGTWSPPESPMSDVSSVASSGQTSPLLHSLRAEDLPPLTVLMCWHAHLLNPGQYSIDANGTYAWLHNLPFPLELAAEAVRKGTLPDEIPHVYATDLRPTPCIHGWTPPDISAAVQRQARLIGTISGLGWLDKPYIDGDITPFQQAIVRYHAWLDLIATIPDHPVITPTFDIQLVWGTHQLRGARYRSDTARVMGDGEPLDRPIDRVDQSNEALHRAAKLWKARFKHEYTTARKPVRRSTV